LGGFQLRPDGSLGPDILPSHDAAMPNFLLLDISRPEIGSLVVAMLQARQAVDRRSWSHPQEPAGEEWWADVLADPRARHKQVQFRGALIEYYRLGDETRSTVLTACTKCDWKAAFNRDELIAAHGPDYPLPDLLQHLAAPRCSRVGSCWDRCGVHYVNPIEGSRPTER
jgi:hypothetical protein